MSAVFGNVGASAGDVNDFHSNSDVDKSTLSQHHTLGPQPNQASAGDHNHDGRNTRRIQGRDLATPHVSYQPELGTLGTQPTFSSSPLITGNFILLGNLCHFSIDVDMDNITGFGTGQYFLTLPFTSSRNYILRDGCVHDFSTSSQYSIAGHIVAGADQMELFSTSSSGQDVAFTSSVPFSLATADNFHIAGTYVIQN